MEFSRVACVGAGLIGHGWATVFLPRCSEVVLQDVSEARIEEALHHIRENLLFLEAQNLLEAGGAASALKRLRTTTRIAEAVSGAQYVQESVTERYEVKKEVFREMDAQAPGDAILASSASGLLMTEIQKAARKPGRCLLVHPMLPVHLLPCVEIAGGSQTSPQVIDATRRFMEEVGKVPVVLKKELPGYIVNRLQAAILREAIDLVHSGVAGAEDVDKAFRTGVGLRDPIMGPLLRIHLAGDGVENFFDRFAGSYRGRWESMVHWTSIPPDAAASVVKGVRAMESVRTKSIEELTKWRDEMLVRVRKAVGV
jgi:3-hydroxyacyl-CoA dehydrogenase